MSDRRFIDLMTQLVLWTLVVSTCIHEYGHLLSVRVLGGEGMVISGDLDAMHWVTLPSNNLWFVYLGGGLFASAIFLLAYRWCADWELRFCFLFNASMQIAYGVGESLFHARETVLSTVLGMCFALFVVYWVILRHGKPTP